VPLKTQIVANDNTTKVHEHHISTCTTNYLLITQ